MESVKKWLTERTAKRNGIFVHYSPPKLVGIVSAAQLRQWARGGSEARLERAVLAGQGRRLLAEAEALPISHHLPALVAKCDALHAAVEKGSLLELQELLESDYNRRKYVMCRDEAGVGLLHKAIYYDYMDIAEWLVKHYPLLVHQKDSEGRTPLHYSAVCRDEAAAAALLEGAGAARGARDAAGHTPAHYRGPARTLLTLPIPADMARETKNQPGLVIKRHNIRIWCHDCDMARLQRVVWEGHGTRLLSEVSNQPVVKKFLEAVPYIMNTIRDIHNAVIKNDLEGLIKLAGDPVPPQALSCRDNNNMTVLHKAAGLGYGGILKWVAERYPQGINEVDNDGRTALHYAAAVKDDRHAYNTLVTLGADEGAVDNKNRTPAYYLSRPQEIDKNVFKTLPDAPRTPSSAYPPSWDWSLLDTEVVAEMNHKKHNRKKNFKASNENISSRNNTNTLSNSTDHVGGMKGSSTLESIKNLPDLDESKSKPKNNKENAPIKDTEVVEDNGAPEENNEQNNSEENVAENDKVSHDSHNIEDPVIQEEDSNEIKESDEGTKDTEDDKNENNETEILEEKNEREILDEHNEEQPENTTNLDATSVAIDTENENKVHNEEQPENTTNLDATSVVIDTENENKVHNEEQPENTTNLDATSVVIDTENENKVHNEEQPENTTNLDAKSVVIDSESENKVHNNDDNKELEAKEIDKMNPENTTKTNDNHDEEATNDDDQKDKNNDTEENNENNTSDQNVADPINETEKILENQMDANKEETVYKVEEEQKDTSKSEGNSSSDHNNHNGHNNHKDHNEKNEDDDDVQVQGDSHSEYSDTNLRSTAEMSDIGSAKRGNVSNGRNSQQSLIEGIVSGDAEQDSQDASITEKEGSVNGEILVVDNEIDPEVTELINSANMEMLAALVLNGEGARLVGRSSRNSELQAFLDNVPIYMQKINKVHMAAKEGNIRDLQAALDRRKFAIARDPISPNGATPLHVATVFGKTNIMKYLGGRFPETLSAVDFEGRTALHYAAVLPDNGYYYNLLQQLGANSKDLDDSGHSAEDYVKNQNLLPFKQLISDYGISEQEAQEMMADKGTSYTVNGHMDIPIFKTDEGRYLAKSLGDPLIKGLTEVANVKPQDPVAFLARFLQNFPEHEKPRLGTQEDNVIVTREAAEVENEQSPAPPTTPPEQTSGALRSAARTAIKPHRPIEVVTVDPHQETSPDAPEAAFSSADRDEHGQSMLHFAAARTHTRNALFQLLQESDISLAYRDELYRTARDVSIQANVPENTAEIDRFLLHLAARGNTDKIMDLLLEGYDHILDVVDDEGVPINEVVAQRGDNEMSGLLASIPTFEESRESLHATIRRGDMEAVRAALSGEGGRTLARGKNAFGRTALHVAVLAQHEEIVAQLAQDYPELLRIGDNLERTPLHYAMGVEKIESLSRVLIRAGAKRVLKDLKGRQPSYYFMNKSDILRLKEEEEVY